MSISLLDRPVWNALSSGWSALAEGDGLARRIAPEYGPFGAPADGSEAAQAALARLIPDGGELWIVEQSTFAPPPGLRVVRQAALAQMIAETVQGDMPQTEPSAMTDDDADQMRALAALTRPGPFHALTHRLGRFIGVRENGVLVAMAGERMRMPGLAEVSGVCTHPDHRGRGHAGALMRHLMQAMLARGETPFLHAYAAHEATIALYEALGFRMRARMQLTVVTGA